MLKHKFIHTFYYNKTRLSSVESQILETKDFTKYQGMWVAILDKKVIASGKTIGEVYDKVADSKVIRTPLFQKIPAKGEIDTFIL